VFDTGEDEEGRPFLVMERLPGLTLADRMAAGPLPEPEVMRIAGDVLAALTAAEQIGLVHRDIKPANILMTEDGCAKVADFGIAKAAEATGDATATGLLLGTPAYLAPERIEGRPATNRSDLYALGVILFEALSGRRAFKPGTAAAVATAALTAGVPRLGPDEASPSTAAAVAVATAADPEQRFPNAAAMAAALGLSSGLASDATAVMAASGAAAGVGAADQTTVLPAAPPPTPSPTAPVVAALATWRERLGLEGNRLAVVAASAAAVLVLVLASWAWGGGGGGGSVTPTTSVPAVQATVPATVPTTVPAVVPKRKGHKGHDD
jgi:serine/threonine-protein kinase